MNIPQYEIPERKKKNSMCSNRWKIKTSSPRKSNSLPLVFQTFRLADHIVIIVSFFNDMPSYILFEAKL